MDIFKIKDFDRSRTVWENMVEMIDYLPSQKPFKVIGELETDLFNDILSVYRTHLQYSFTEQWNNSDRYYGRCFNYNDYAPRIQDSQYSADYPCTDMRYGYESSLAFYRPTNIGTYFEHLLYPFQIVRSKLARLTPGAFEGDWHQDEDPRECAKLIIPVRTSLSYKFQIEGSEPFHIPLGSAVLFDASIPHRIISDGSDNSHRDYLVFNLPVWWEVSNEEITKSKFFGRSIPDTVVNEANIFKIPEA